MVVKQRCDLCRLALRFESRVILDGSQTSWCKLKILHLFESRVILDGSQTGECGVSMSLWFESRVILDGSQTELV